MATNQAEAHISAMPQQPRVGVAIFLLTDRPGGLSSSLFDPSLSSSSTYSNHPRQPWILLGKRIGAHGAGTLALPGGHLENGETLAQCAARECLEETGLEVEFETVEGGHPERNNGVHEAGVVECTDLDGKDGEKLHYLTFFMKGWAKRTSDQREVNAKVLEPNKCAGWVWVPLSYCLALSAAQTSLEHMTSVSAQEGRSFDIPMERLLLAERLGERIARQQQNDGSTGESYEARSLQAPWANTSAPTTPGLSALSTRGGAGGGPKDDDETIAFALADDLAQGAGFFRPLHLFFEKYGEEGSATRLFGPRTHARKSSDLTALTSPQRTSHNSTAHSITSPLNLEGRLPLHNHHLDASATDFINRSLTLSAPSDPPHLKHSLLFTIPLPSPTHADNLIRILSVDKPLRPSDTSITYERQADKVVIELKASTTRILRLAGNAVLEDISLVARTMQDFPGPSAADVQEHTSSRTTDEEAVIFEDGTVGTVERTAI